MTLAAASTFRLNAPAFFVLGHTTSIIAPPVDERRDGNAEGEAE